MSKHSANFSDQSMLHHRALLTDETIYTIQSLLSVCKIAADHASHCDDKNEVAAISSEISTCSEQAGKMLLNVREFSERVKVLSAGSKNYEK